MNRRTFLASLASGAAAVVLGVVGLRKSKEAAPKMPKTCPVCGLPGPSEVFVGMVSHSPGGAFDGLRDCCQHGAVFRFSEVRRA